MDAVEAKPGLWKRSLGPDAHVTHASTRDRFRQALADMNKRASELAGEISRDLPEFTQHDISHLDALWELADLIAGPDAVLNPAEGFVLGASILTHDLAMSRSSHLLAGGGIRARVEWPDALAAELRRHLGRAPYPAELAAPAEEIATRAEKFLLRDLHASIAEILPTSSWTTQDNATAYLIADAEIRSAYGRLIGAVAASHHWDYDRVVDSLGSPVGVPGFAPVNWTVDTLLLASLLRTADAAHLDSSRAPDLLAAVRDLPEESKNHWLFQSRLQRPYLKNDRLVFTASQGFGREEMNAWWLAYDALRVVDDELRNADSVLVENGRPRLAARGVSNVDSPKSFRDVSPCRDWEPVGAEIAVNDVAGLVERLGGRELYGSDWTVALREIVVNSCDAVKAREALAEYRGRRFYGSLSVWLEQDDGGIWLVCSDNGIGMSPSVMGHQLLDFGCSSWLAPAVTRDNPGLVASRFNPTGRFGIGFFSVFMMGDQVQVISRSQKGAPADTWILEFGHGVSVRPCLRRAAPSEELDDPGTTVKVLLNDTLISSELELVVRISSDSMSLAVPASLARILEYILPAPEIDVYFGSNGPSSIERLMSKDDWLTIDGAVLLNRVMGHHILANSGLDREGVEEWVAHHAARMQLVRDADGRPIGRAALIDSVLSRELDRWGQNSSTVTAGPARTRTAIHGTAGLFVGIPERAARDSARPIADRESIAAWIGPQVDQLVSPSGAVDEQWVEDIAGAIIELGGSTGALEFWKTKEGWLTQSELIDWISRRDCIYVVHPVYAHARVGTRDISVELIDDAVYFETGRRRALTGHVTDWPLPESKFYSGGIPGAFGAAIREAWSLPDTVDLESCWVRDDTRKVGSYQGEDIQGDVAEFKRSEFL
ncbi:ATP-binding protein [Streptomyces pseudovenezuelae]|uniref:HD domain-containing protein n=1 Tax=Streptomyces pseudovenezuelae TaxID=67350 RepID=UPI002E322DEC|nr:ATP-binding protein [Streptomyces pseudovenezuelae]